MEEVKAIHRLLIGCMDCANDVEDAMLKILDGKTVIKIPNIKLSELIRQGLNSSMASYRADFVMNFRLNGKPIHRLATNKYPDIIAPPFWWCNNEMKRWFGYLKMHKDVIVDAYLLDSKTNLNIDEVGNKLKGYFNGFINPFYSGDNINPTFVPTQEELAIHNPSLFNPIKHPIQNYYFNLS